MTSDFDEATLNNHRFAANISAVPDVSTRARFSSAEAAASVSLRPWYGPADMDRGCVEAAMRETGWCWAACPNDGQASRLAGMLD
jgi:hypothetical protein